MKNFSRAMFVAMTIAVTASACGGSKPPATEPTANSAVSPHGSGMCPMHVPGTQVSVEDTSDGVAKVFTTTGDVTELRRRVHQMAERHEQMSKDHPMGPGGAGPGGMGPGMGAGPGPGMGAGHMGDHKHMMAHAVPSTARAEDIDRGARLNLTPKDPTKLAELRAHVRERAAHMASGQCPMEQAHH